MKGKVASPLSQNNMLVPLLGEYKLWKNIKAGWTWIMREYELWVIWIKCEYELWVNMNYWCSLELWMNFQLWVNFWITVELWNHWWTFKLWVNFWIMVKLLNYGRYVSYRLNVDRFNMNVTEKSRSSSRQTQFFIG